MTKIESFLAGTPFKTPVAVVNILIELGQVCSIEVYVTLYTNFRLQAVKDNRDTTKDFISRLLHDRFEFCCILRAEYFDLYDSICTHQFLLT